MELISLFVPVVFDFSPIESTTYRWLNLHFFQIHSQNLQNNFHFQGWKHLVFSKGLEKKSITLESNGSAKHGQISAHENSIKFCP